jgi:hypothetical protein
VDWRFVKRLEGVLLTFLSEATDAMTPDEKYQYAKAFLRS